MAAEGKIDPMHQFTIERIAPLHIGPYDVSFTNSSAWMVAALVLIFGFMAMGMKRAAGQIVADLTDLKDAAAAVAADFPPMTTRQRKRPERIQKKPKRAASGAR